MSILGMLLTPAERKDLSSYGPVDSLWAALFGARETKSGVTVSWQRALEVSTVLACARRIAEGVSTVPLKVYLRQANGGRQEARDHPLYDLINSRPNEYQTSLEFRETIAFHTVLTGNGFAFKNMNGRGQITELTIIDPGKVQVIPQMNGTQVSYRVTSQEQLDVPAELIWHIRGPSWNSACGLDMVKTAREAIGLAAAAEMTHSEAHANGIRTSGVFSVDGTLDATQLARLAAWIRANFQGAEHSGKPLILDRAAKFMPLTMTGVDAEHMELRRHQIEEICRALAVLPIMVGHYDKAATYASSEQMFLAHLVHTVRPWHRRFEGSMDLNLLSAQDRKAGYYTAFTDAEFLRAAAKDRSEFYKIALGGGGNPGWMTPNDVRALEDMSPETGADRLYAPVNLAPIAEDGTLELPEPPPPPPVPIAAGKVPALTDQSGK